MHRAPRTSTVLIVLGAGEADRDRHGMRLCRHVASDVVKEDALSLESVDRAAVVDFQVLGSS